MEQRRLGRLDRRISVLIYGSAALGEVDQEVADASIQQALDAGITHIDTAAGYGDAELRLAPWMPVFAERQVFVSTKTHVRDGDAAWAQINESLTRLGTDRVDLIQLHSVGDLAELDACTRRGGALEAAVRARDEGLAGHIGITGHGHAAPSTHVEALRRFPFETVLTPLNPILWARPEYRADYLALVEQVHREDVGLMTIKTGSRRNYPGERSHATWYEPLVDAEAIRAAVSWVLARPEISGLATPGDVRLLAAVIAAEADRMTAEDADRAAGALLADPEYSSPFERMPF